MKKNIFVRWLFVVLFMILSAGHSQTYTVEIKVTDLWYDDNPESYRATLEAVIYHNGEVVPPSSNYYYEWHVYYAREGYWKISTISDFGANISRPETIVESGNYILSYVVVTDSINHTFTGVQSDTVGPLEMTRLGWNVDFYAYDENGNLLSNVLPEHWRYTINTWKIGYNGLLTRDYDEKLRPTPVYFSDSNRKFQYWNSTQSDIKYYKTFHITTQVNQLTAHYNKAEGHPKFDIHLMPGVESPYDSIEFKDPWVVDTTDSRFYTAPYGYHSLGMDTPFLREAVPFTLSVNSKYQGVFLNQRFDLPGNPCYSVRAPSPQILPFHGEDIAWYFQGWEGSNVSFQDASASETPVVFLADSAEVRAVYKGHLVTDNLSRLGFSSQRHIARGGTTWYLTYWEDGKIYVSTSTDGVNWNPEVCVSGNLDGCSRPSIAAGLVNGYAYVVWQRKIDTDQYEVYVSRTSNSGQSWSSPHKLSTVHITTAQRYGPQPVVAEMRVENLTNSAVTTMAAPGPSYTYHTLIAYVCDSGLKWHKSTNQGASWGSQQNIPVANTTYVWFPSMVSGTDYVALVYSYRYGGYEVTSRLYKGNGWSSPANVSGALGLIYDRIPSVSIDRNGNLFCAWLAQKSGNTNYKIAIRQGDSNNNWSSFNKTAFYPPDGSSAHGVNINFINNTDLDVVFHTTGKRVYRREYPPSLEGYVSHTQLSSNGYYGNLPAFRQSDFADAFALWLEDTGAPYLIKNTLNLNHGSDAAGVVAQVPAVSRRVVVCLAPGDHVGARFLLGDIRVGSQRVKLSSVGKDGVALSGATVGEYLRSEVFHVAAGAVLRARVEREVATGLVDSTGAVLSSGDYDGIMPYVEVLNVADGGVVWRGEVALGQHEFEWVGGQDIPAGDYVLRVMVTSDRQGYSWYTHTESSYVKSPMAGNDVLASEEGMEKDNPSTLPQKYDLKPAYPNPFNPSTTIGYALPEASEVALEVYNVQGQRIRELVGGRQPAGWHAVVWDGRNSNGKPVPSGVYVVRMTAQPVSGTGNAFVASRKVVLMK